MIEEAGRKIEAVATYDQWNFFNFVAIFQSMTTKVVQSRNQRSVPSKGGWIVREGKSGRFVEVRPDRASRSLDKIADRIKGQPSKLDDLFRLHKEHQSKRA